MPTSEIAAAPTRSRSRVRNRKRSRPSAAAIRLGLRALLLALATGVLLWLCYFPVAWGWLAWFALVPLLALVRSPARPARHLSECLGRRTCLFRPAMRWMRVADPRMYFTWLFVADLLLALFPPRSVSDTLPRPPHVLAAGPHRAGRVDGPGVLPLDFITGFSWYLLGHTQHTFLPLIQIADLTGAYGVSFLVAAVNALLFEILWGRRWFRAWVSGPDAPPRWGRIGLLVQGLAVLARCSARRLTASGVWGRIV